MASSVTACRLCYDQFSLKIPEKIPRHCQCQHIFCTGCIEKLYLLQGSAIECPICMTITYIPQNGINYLPKNFDVLGIEKGSKVYEQCKHCRKITYPPKLATLHCVDCQTVYCGSCSDTIHLKKNNQDHLLRLANSLDDLKLQRRPSSIMNPDQPLTPKINTKPTPTRKQSYNQLLVCEEHDLFLNYFCQHDQVRCCSQCKDCPKHNAHDCNVIQSFEDHERIILVDLKMQLDHHIDRFDKSRVDKQKVMEELKQNTVMAAQNVKRCFQELRHAITGTESELLEEVQQYCSAKLNRIQDQYSDMFEMSNVAKVLSRNCEKASEMEYFEIVVQKKKLESEIFRSINRMKNYNDTETTDIFIQFPQHETLLASLRTSAYIVRAPLPPCNYKCTLSSDGDVLLSWDTQNRKFTYSSTLYGVYAGVGEKDTFVMLKKVSEKRCEIKRNHELLAGKLLVQFQVTAINIIGESAPCFPLCLRLGKSRI